MEAFFVVVLALVMLAVGALALVAVRKIATVTEEKQ